MSNDVFVGAMKTKRKYNARERCSKMERREIEIDLLHIYIADDTDLRKTKRWPTLKPNFKIQKYRKLVRVDIALSFRHNISRRLVVPHSCGSLQTHYSKIWTSSGAKKRKSNIFRHSTARARARNRRENRVRLSRAILDILDIRYAILIIGNTWSLPCA